MSDDSNDTVKPSRRGFLAGAGGLLAAAGATAAAGQPSVAADAPAAPPVDKQKATEPFFGPRQAGIETSQQSHTYVAALDLATTKRDDIIGMLKTWTRAAANMTAGKFAAPMNQDLAAPGADSNEASGLAPARLTLTFGFGAGMFVKDGKDRYGLAAHRPEAMVDLPRFNGDQLVDTKTGGDLSIQACADDPQVAFHAVRQLVRLAYGAADMRWTQSGFLSTPQTGGTPRNLMGFKDGTGRPTDLDKFVWVGDEGKWMKGGSYAVVRRIRIALEHWDRTEVDFQEQVIGRQKYSGAPIGGKKEFDKIDFDAADKDGNPIIADTAHLRLAHASTNGGAQILRRGYSYNDGVNFTAERWPPWRQGMEYDAGLLFVAYQRDPRTGFIKIFEKMSKLDMLNQFVTHTGGGLFACPRGVADGEYIGQPLFEI
ncbi:MAG TPA: iron uptake transporter deferrochelatase/peroxidase subunit [Magnetospirillaceae bacterium]|jgi:deferrochelatase/peroxidase EfeB